MLLHGLIFLCFKHLNNQCSCAANSRIDLQSGGRRHFFPVKVFSSSVVSDESVSVGHVVAAAAALSSSCNIILAACVFVCVCDPFNHC